MNKLLLLIFLGTFGCIDVQFSDKKITDNFAQVYSNNGSRLEELMVESQSQLESLKYRLPEILNGDYKIADEVCLVNGQLDLELVSSDTEIKNKLEPFFRLYCDSKSKDYKGTFRAAIISKSLSCVVTKSDLLESLNRQRSSASYVSLKKAKTCFNEEFSRDWFEVNLEEGEDDRLKVEVQRIDDKKDVQFNYIINMSANTFFGSFRFSIEENISAGLVEYNGPSGRMTFGLTLEKNYQHGIFRYDLMSYRQEFDEDLINLVNRTRFYLHVTKNNNEYEISDFDFWNLNSDQTNFVFGQVSGGENYGLIGSLEKLITNEELGNTHQKKWAGCLDRAQCLEREMKRPSVETIYKLGRTNEVLKSMNKVIRDNKFYLHNRAHFNLTPHVDDTRWIELDGDISKINRSFMKSMIVDDKLYVSDGLEIVDNEVITAQASLDIDLFDFSVSKGNNSFVQNTEDDNVQLPERRNSGFIDNDYITFEFGGLSENSHSTDTGKLIIKSHDGNREIPIDQSFFESNNFENPVYSRFSPVVVYTGRHIILYGGLHYDENFRIATVSDGFVIDTFTVTAKQMNMELSPKWITQAVWTGEFLIAWGGLKVSYSDVYPLLSGHDHGGIYHLETNSWSKIPVAPIGPRLGHEMVWHDGRLLIFGGQNSLVNVSGFLPQFVDGAAVFVPGKTSKIYFTENYYKSLSDNKVIVSDNIGSFYVDGEIHPNSALEVYYGAGCASARLGKVPEVSRHFLGAGKAIVEFNLEMGENIISVKIKNGEKEVCTNAIVFNRI